MGKPRGQPHCRRDRQRLPLAAVHHSLVAVIPLARLLVGTSIGTAAAIVPLSISGIPYFGRVSEVALREVDRGLIEAVERWAVETGLSSARRSSRKRCQA